MYALTKRSPRHVAVRYDEIATLLQQFGREIVDEIEPFVVVTIRAQYIILRDAWCTRVHEMLVAAGVDDDDDDFVDLKVAALDGIN
jgi:hypothetical protein